MTHAHQHLIPRPMAGFSSKQASPSKSFSPMRVNDATSDSFLFHNSRTVVQKLRSDNIRFNHICRHWFRLWCGNELNVTPYPDMRTPSLSPKAISHAGKRPRQAPKVWWRAFRLLAPQQPVEVVTTLFWLPLPFRPADERFAHKCRQRFVRKCQPQPKPTIALTYLLFVIPFIILINLNKHWMLKNWSKNTYNISRQTPSLVCLIICTRHSAAVNHPKYTSDAKLGFKPLLPKRKYLK